jgi:hypothetical protein
MPGKWSFILQTLFIGIQYYLLVLIGIIALPALIPMMFPGGA